MGTLKQMQPKVHDLTVLIVDDEREVLAGSSYFFNKLFDRVDTAGNGVEALRKFNDNGGYDIVISDVMMPHMDGWQLLDAVRATGKHCFTVIVTASVNRQEYGERPYDMYVEKPIDFEQLTAMIEQIIRFYGR